MGKAKRLPMDVTDLGLEPAQLRFLGEYCTNGFDESAAFSVAYPRLTKNMEPGEIKIEGQVMANQREMKIAVQRYVSSVIDPYRDTTEAELLQVYRSRALYDPANYIDKDGNAKPLEEIDRVHRYAIDGYKKSYYGRNADREVREVTFANRTQSLKQLEEFLSKGKESNVETVPDDTKKRLKDIFAGVDKGLKIAKDLGTIKQAEQFQSIEYHDTEYVEMEVDVDAPVIIPVEQSPIVIGAKKVAARETGGILVETNPLVQKAREFAQAEAIKKKEQREVARIAREKAAHERRMR